MTKETIKKKIKEIKNTELLSAPEIIKLGLITDTNLKPSLFSLYRIIKNGQLKAVNMGNGNVKRYFVEGKDLKRFLVKRYQL